MKLKLNLKRNSGSALMITIATALVLGIVIGSCLNMVATQNKSVARSQAWNSAMPAAEAGVEEAFSHYFRNKDNLASDGWVLNGYGYYQKSRNIDSQSSFWVGIKNMTPPIIVSTGYVTVPFSTTNKVSRTVVILTEKSTPFSKAIVSMTFVDQNGSWTTVDSFDSTNSAYSSGGMYDWLKHRDNGDIASVQGIVDILNIGNAKIYGSLHTGPGGSADIGPNGSVGTTNWVSGGNKGIQTNHFADDINLSFPDVKPPNMSVYSTPGPGIIGTTNYDYVLTNSAPYTNYMYSSDFDGTLYVKESSVLYLKQDVKIKKVVIAPNATLKLYQGTSDASQYHKLEIDGNAVVNYGGYASQMRYYGLPSVKKIALGGNGHYTGTIYAPQAAFVLNGGGSDIFDVVGAAIVYSAKLNGHFNLHYDEALQALDDGFVVVKSWWEM